MQGFEVLVGVVPNLRLIGAAKQVSAGPVGPCSQMNEQAKGFSAKRPGAC